MARNQTRCTKSSESDGEDEPLCEIKRFKVNGDFNSLATHSSSDDVADEDELEEVFVVPSSSCDSQDRVSEAGELEDVNETDPGGEKVENFEKLKAKDAKKGTKRKGKERDGEEETMSVVKTKAKNGKSERRYVRKVKKDDKKVEEEVKEDAIGVGKTKPKKGESEREKAKKGNEDKNGKETKGEEEVMTVEKTNVKDGKRKREEDTKKGKKEKVEVTKSVGKLREKDGKGERDDAKKGIKEKKRMGMKEEEDAKSISKMVAKPGKREREDPMKNNKDNEQKGKKMKSEEVDEDEDENNGVDKLKDNNASGRRRDDAKGKKNEEVKETTKGKTKNRKSKNKADNSLHLFPMHRINRIIRNQGSDIRIFTDAVFIINRATEMFLELFTKEAYAAAFLDRNNYIGYNHLASTVSKRERFDFLSDFVPEKVKVEDVLSQLPSTTDS